MIKLRPQHAGCSRRSLGVEPAREFLPSTLHHSRCPRAASVAIKQAQACRPLCRIHASHVPSTHMPPPAAHPQPAPRAPPTPNPHPETRDPDLPYPSCTYLSRSALTAPKTAAPVLRYLSPSRSHAFLTRHQPVLHCPCPCTYRYSQAATMQAVHAQLLYAGLIGRMIGCIGLSMRAVLHVDVCAAAGAAAARHGPKLSSRQALELGEVRRPFLHVGVAALAWGWGPDGRGIGKVKVRKRGGAWGIGGGGMGVRDRAGGVTGSLGWWGNTVRPVPVVVTGYVLTLPCALIKMTRVLHGLCGCHCAVHDTRSAAPVCVNSTHGSTPGRY